MFERLVARGKWIMALFEAILMYPFGVPFIHWGMESLRLSDGNEVERNQVVREVEYVPDRSDAFFVGIDAGPDTSQSNGMGGE